MRVDENLILKQATTDENDVVLKGVGYVFGFLDNSTNKKKKRTQKKSEEKEESIKEDKE